MTEMSKDVGLLNVRIKKKTKHPVLKTLSVCVLTLMLCEGFLWVLEANNLIIEPYEWGEREDIPFKVNECHALFSKPENQNKVKVLMLGDSRPMTSLNPHKLDTLFNNKTITYNLAIARTSIRFTSVFIQNIVIPKLKPNIVLWDFQIPDDFKEDTNTIIDDYILTTPMGRYYTNNYTGLDIEGWCEQFLMGFSRIFRYKSNFLQHALNLNLNSLEQKLVRGYFPLIGTFDSGGAIMQNVTHNYTFYEESETLILNNLEKFNQYSQYHLIITGPYRLFRQLDAKVYSIFNEIPSNNFLDLNGNVSFSNDIFWYNDNHLNPTGADLYTQFVFDKIMSSSVLF